VLALDRCAYTEQRDTPKQFFQLGEEKYEGITCTMVVHIVAGMSQGCLESQET